jgi:hypothetical protein
LETKGLTGVGEESPTLGKNSPNLGKMMEPTLESSNPQHHGVELDEINSMVVSFCIGSGLFCWKSSPDSSIEFCRCESSVTVCGS